MLFDRNLPAFIIRVLFDIYSRQESRAMWIVEFMLYRLLLHVKQCKTRERFIGNISLYMYIDKLLIMLRDSGFGCKIDNCYTGDISPTPMTSLCLAQLKKNSWFESYIRYL